MTDLSHGSSHDMPFRERLTCTVREACQATGLGRTKLNQLIAEGRLASVKLDQSQTGRRLVSVPSLVALMEGPR